MIRYAGLDVHREVLVACIIDSDGHCLERHRIELSRSNLERFARERLRRDDSVALEATTNTWAVVEVIEPYVERVVVANPLRTRAIAEAKGQDRQGGFRSAGPTATLRLSGQRLEARHADSPTARIERTPGGARRRTDPLEKPHPQSAIPTANTRAVCGAFQRKRRAMAAATTLR